MNSGNFISQCNAYLESRWKQISELFRIKGSNMNFVKEDLKLLLINCQQSKTKSYHYVLPTQLLSKIIDHSLDCHSLQASYDKPGSFDARSIAHQVIVPFDKNNYNVLGGSPEPYVNNPLRCPAVIKENSAKQKNKEDWLKLISILDLIEKKNDIDFTKKVFDQLLIEIYKLLSNVRVIYPTPNRISYNQTINLITKYIEEKSAGERVEAVATALFQTIMYKFKIFDNIKREKVNASDSSSGMAADIECYLRSKIVLLVEVKDQTLTITQMDTKLTTARYKQITEILFIAEKGINEKSLAEIDKRIAHEFISGQNIYITNIIQFIHSISILLGETGRSIFLHNIGKELDRVQAPIIHKKAWANLLKSL